MTFKEYADYDGMGLAALVAKGEVTPAEITEAAIERIERLNPALNAVVYKAYDEARAVAKAPLPDGPLKGAPFLVKDLC
jgi:amidase